MCPALCSLNSAVVFIATKASHVSRVKNLYFVKGVSPLFTYFVTRMLLKVLQTRNTHPHRLGTAGYAGKIPQWRREDEEAIRSEASPPFAGIADERARRRG